MQELFRWALGAAVIASFITFILELLGARVWLQLTAATLLAIFGVVHGMRHYGVPDSAFRTGGIIALAVTAGLLIGSSVQEILEYIVVLVLFALAYFIGGFAGKMTLRQPKHGEKHDENE